MFVLTNGLVCLFV